MTFSMESQDNCNNNSSFIRAPGMRMRGQQRFLLISLIANLAGLIVSQVSMSQRFLIASMQEDTPMYPAKTTKNMRLGVVTFVDKRPAELWGVFSIHNQMEKFNMTKSATHMVLVAHDLLPQHKGLLREWLGPDQVREVDADYIRGKVPGGLWKQVFSKIEAFNMTDFDKLIVLDNDVLIRRSLLHWFDYPAPAATQSRSTIEWNSGAMVIEPSTELYRQLIDYIPRTRAWKPESDDGMDTWNSNHHDQGFLSSFFTSNMTNVNIHTMSYGSSVLSSDLERVAENKYFWKYRPHLIETVHFTRHKPWRGRTTTKAPQLCAAFREWLDSVSGVPENKLPALSARLFESCQGLNETSTSSTS